METLRFCPKVGVPEIAGMVELVGGIADTVIDSGVRETSEA